MKIQLSKAHAVLTVMQVCMQYNPVLGRVWERIPITEGFQKSAYLLHSYQILTDCGPIQLVFISGISGGGNIPLQQEVVVSSLSPKIQMKSMYKPVKSVII